MCNWMSSIICRLIAPLGQEDGQDIVEYALLASMIGLGVTASTRSMSQALLSVFDNIRAALSTNIT